MRLPVTLQEVKDDLRVTWDEEDAVIAMKLASARAAVLNYLKIDSFDAFAVGSPAVIPERIDEAIAGAIVFLAANLYRYRDADADHEWELGSLPRPVVAMLYPLRDPAYA